MGYFNIGNPVKRPSALMEAFPSPVGSLIMRHLFLLRHAKADKAMEDQDDFDRPLASRGMRDADRLARVLPAQRLPPLDLVLCSSARRTWETCERVAPALSPKSVVAEEGLYATSASALLSRLRLLEDSLQTVLVVGHNPSLEEVTRLLVGQPLPDTFSPGTLAVLEVNQRPWAELAHARLVNFLHPRDFADFS